LSVLSFKSRNKNLGGGPLQEIETRCHLQ
jgi:hypothetical protein